MRMIGWFVAGCLAALVMLTGCGPDKAPSRDYLPVLTEGMTHLQTAVLTRDTAAIDSLMVSKLRHNNRGADSLLSYVYGPDNSFAFEQFGNYEIVYTRTKARIDCYIMDSTGTADRPTTFTYEFEKGQWLLKDFGPRKGPLIKSDTAQ